METPIKPKSLNFKKYCNYFLNIKVFKRFSSTSNFKNFIRELINLNWVNLFSELSFTGRLKYTSASPDSLLTSTPIRSSCF